MMFSKTILYTLIIFFCSIYSLIAQPNADGIPFVTNYDLDTYLAEESNWSVAQDDRGVMYFGNDEAVLEYDGTVWRKIKVPGQLYIYSMTSSKDGTIYLGGVDDFGRLIVNNEGKKVYESLKYLIEDSSTVLRVWKTYVKKGNVYFCTIDKIYKYFVKAHKIEVINLNTKTGFLTFFVNGKFYLSDYEDGIMEISDDNKTTVSNVSAYLNKDIFAMLNWSADTILVATKQEGLTLLNVKTGVVSDFAQNEDAKRTNEILIDANIYSGVEIGENRFAFGTLNNGIFLINKKGCVLMHLNEKNGMQNNVVTNIYYTGNNEGILWATLLSGITSVNLNSQVGYFSEESGLDVALYGIAEHKNITYVSTFEGVYKMQVDAEDGIRFVPIQNDNKERTYDLINFISPNGKEILLAGSVNDIYEIKNGKLKKLGVEQEINRLYQSKINPSILYAATAKGIMKFNYKNGEFIKEKGILGVKDKYVASIVEDKNGDLWYNTLSESVLISPEGKVKSLPKTIQDKDGFFFGISNMVFFASGKELLKYNYETGEFQHYEQLNNYYGKIGREYKKFFTLSDTSGVMFYGVNHKSLSELVTYSNGNWQIDSTAYKILPSMSYNSAYQNSNYVMLGGQEGLFLVRNVNAIPKTRFNTLIRRVNIGSDSIFYDGNENFKIEENDSIYKLFAIEPITYRYNNINFQYSSLFFEKEDEIVYSSYLKGFDSKWSSWSKDLSRGYTNLKEGEYSFLLKAKNIYGNESKLTIFNFEILPPWYRTWWAFSIYLIFAFVIIRISIMLYTRKLQEDKKRLERIVEERTAEIIEKNHRIERQNIAITDSIKYAKRIQNAVLPDKQTSGLFEYFIYFKPKDIVSGDFYWVSNLEKQNRLVVVAADCTGHGVPGAFMSMLGTSFLNEIVAKLDVVHSDDVLNLLRENVIKTLNQGTKGREEERQKDGMDMALASIDLETLTLEYSGANNPLVLIRDDELIEYKPDKMPIGAYVKQDIPFTRKEIELKKHDVFYMFSDGYVDQFGGPRGRKYMKKRFKEFLHAIHKNPMHEQRRLLSDEMFKWMDGQEQIDDQIVIGMRLIN